MATTVNLSIDQGTHFSRTLTINGDETPTPLPKDLTGYTFSAQARPKFGSTEVAFSFTFTIRTQTGGDVGKVDMTLVPADTESIAMAVAKTYVYDVEMTDLSGNKSRLFQGTATINPEVTKT